MKTFKKYRVVILLVIVLISLHSCETEIEVEFTDPTISSFSLRSSDGLSDYACAIQNDTIIGLFSDSNNSFCIPTIVGDFDYVEINGQKVIMGETVVDFNTACVIDCVKGTGEKVKRHSYTAIVKTQNGIPRVDIFTEGGAKIDSKEDYVKGTITIGNDPENGFYKGELEIRGRGNCTWTDYPKKPYKVKLKEKESIHGMPENKDWVLLADYTDRSLMRTACMAEISKIVGMPYTINYSFVDLYINNEYLGTYYLTDQVEKGKNRVDISDNGYLIEDDKYYKEEPLFFTSALDQVHFTFKYPQKLTAEDERFTWIQTFINETETALHNNSDEYLNYIDIDSFAKWFIVEELLGNYDSNVYYTLNKQGDRLQMYPVWDAEWSLGLAYLKNGLWMPPEYGSPVDVEIWRERLYFPYLFNQQSFISHLKEVWGDVNNELKSTPECIEKIAQTISLSQKDNFDKWQTIGKYVRVEVAVQESWEKEVEYLNDFYRQRYVWLNDYINSIN